MTCLFQVKPFLTNQIEMINSPRNLEIPIQIREFPIQVKAYQEEHDNDHKNCEHWHTEEVTKQTNVNFPMNELKHNLKLELESNIKLQRNSLNF